MLHGILEATLGKTFFENRFQTRARPYTPNPLSNCHTKFAKSIHAKLLGNVPHGAEHAPPMLSCIVPASLAVPRGVFCCPRRSLAPPHAHAHECTRGTRARGLCSHLTLAARSLAHMEEFVGDVAGDAVGEAIGEVATDAAGAVEDAVMLFACF